MGGTSSNSACEAKLKITRETWSRESGETIKKLLNVFQELDCVSAEQLERIQQIINDHVANMIEKDRAIRMMKN